MPKKKAKRGPGRPPGSTSDATRAKILEAARACFANKGFGLATNRDIAERAGITAGAIYQYFDSKADLYLVTAREAIAEVAVHMQGLAAEDHGAAAGLSKMILGLLAVHEHDPSLASFLSAMPAELQRHPELARVLKAEPNDMPVIAMSVVERGVRNGEIEANEVPAIVGMFIACMMGLSQFSVLFGIEHGAPAAQRFARLLEGRLFGRGTRSVAKART